MEKELVKNASFAELTPSTSSATSRTSCTMVNKKIADQLTPNDTDVIITKEEPTTSNTNKEKPITKKIKNTSKRLLEGWTRDEKFQLYMSIKSKGSKKVIEIQNSIPTKSVEEIKAAISHYWARANENPECATKKIKARKRRFKPLIPLASWATALTDNLDYKDLQTETITALRIIADLEDMPDPVCTDQVNFRKVYHQIADAMEGKTLLDNRMIIEVLNSCVLETALVSKSFIKPSSYRHILNLVNFDDKEAPVFPRPTTNKELAIIRHICALKNYNPLGLSEEHLIAAGSMQTTVNNLSDA